jgi:hypothetical protein
MISENIMKKIMKADEKCRPNLLSIAEDSIFRENENLFDLVLSQTSKHSQDVIYQAIKEGVDNDTLYRLISYTDGPIKQKRILRYSKYDVIMKNEAIYLQMLDIENEYVEGELFRLFQMNKIKDYDQFRGKKIEVEREAKVKKLTKKPKKDLSEEEYLDLKHKRILKDNVLKDVKKILRTFGFLGIDIPRVDDKHKEKNDVVNSFNKNDYQKLFNVDALMFDEERVSVNGTITNAKSNCNFVELSVIFKELLNGYNINNYKINIYNKDIYELTTKYFKENVNLVSNDSYMIKFTSNKDAELIKIFKINGNILFNIKIDKLVDYIIDEKKEKTVSEENLRDTLIYVDKKMEENKKLYECLLKEYLYDFHSIIVYQEDIPKNKIVSYCISNNLKFVGFLEGDNNFRVLPIDKLICSNKSKTLGLINNDNNGKE